MNAINIPYLKSWTNSQSQSGYSKPNLTDMMGYLQGVIQSDPPVDQGIDAAIMAGGSKYPNQHALPIAS